MKTSIPSDVWETKRSQIAVLYKEEEWPLKQVIKKIRTKDFNPTETQLRSRLKKWGVTKPSRQKRKKLSNQTTGASPAANLEQDERERKRDGAPQLLPLPVHATCNHEPERDERRQLLPAANLPHQSNGEPCWENDPASTTITPQNEVFLHAPGNAYAHYPGPQPHPDVAQLPPCCPYDYPPYTTAPPPHCAVESAGSTSHRGSLPPSEAVSPANSLPGGMSIVWRPQEGQIGAETVSTASPASLWNYTPPAPCQPCSPTCLYLAEGVPPLSPGANSDYTKHVLTDSAHKYPLCHNLSPSSDINFWEPAAPYRTWRTSSASSDQIATGVPLKINCGETRACHQGGMSRRPTTHEALVGNRQDIDVPSRSPTLLPELTSSVSDSDACFPDLSPMEGTDLEYILPSPVMS